MTELGAQCKEGKSGVQVSREGGVGKGKGRYLERLGKTVAHQAQGPLRFGARQSYPGPQTKLSDAPLCHW